MIRRLAGSVVLTTCVVLAQSAASPPAFEVASVKPAAPVGYPMNMGYQMRGGPGSSSPGQLICKNVSLKPLLLKAYDLKPYQLAGPASIDGARYDIDAKIPPGATKEQFNRMLQNLLAVRFGVAVHRETRTLPIYEMVVAKGGLKMKEAEKPPTGAPAPAPPQPAAGGSPQTIKSVSRDKDGFPELPPGVPRMLTFGLPTGMRILARMQTVADLLRLLENVIGSPVVDKTGLSGTYDFNLSFMPDTASVGAMGLGSVAEPPYGEGGGPDAASEPAPSLFAALESQLGLKLESKKGPVEVLVVDKMSRTPTEN